ncbi:MAG: hypothetical protein WDN00_00845 [Limisphaerales bacterium]
MSKGFSPSRFNDDHKATFTVSKAKSWSPLSINVLDLGNSLPGGKIISLQLQDRGYDRALLTHGKLQPNFFIRILAKTSGILKKLMGQDAQAGLQRLLVAYFPTDQTSSAQNAQAQIQLIVKKCRP